MNVEIKMQNVHPKLLKCITQFIYHFPQRYDDISTLLYFVQIRNYDSNFQQQCILSLQKYFQL